MKAPAAVLALALFVLAATCPDAQAGLTARQLAEVGASPEPGATLAPGIPVHDVRGPDLTLGDALGGRPALLVPVDYHCRALCGTALAVLAPLLSQTRMQTGRDYTVLVLGMDPNESDADALSMAQARLGAAADGPGVRVL